MHRPRDRTTLASLQIGPHPRNLGDRPLASGETTTPSTMAAARRALAEDGVALLKSALSPSLLERLRAAIEANRAAGRPMSRQVLYTHRPPPPGRPPLSALMDQWLSPFRYEGPGSTAAAAESVRPLASALLGEPAVLFQDLLLIKREGQKAFPWHQDFGFWPVDRPHGVVLWAPLQASDGGSGALRFAPGSHRLGCRPVVDLHDGSTQDRAAELGFDPQAWPSFSPVYDAGDVVAFTPVTFHASPAMQRPGSRAAWSCAFLSPRARWRHASAPNHPLCEVVADDALVTELGHD